MLSEPIKDEWLTPEEACKRLGEDWSVRGDRKVIHRLNRLGVAESSIRIFDGTEHVLAQAGKVVWPPSASRKVLTRDYNPDIPHV